MSNPTTERAEGLPTRYCKVCGKPEDAHPYRHAFVSTNSEYQGLTQVEENDSKQSSSQSSDPSSQGRVRIAPAGDPVLRLALIRNGIITVEDLDKIDAELRVAGVAGHDPSSVG